jgi:hypothetical protein
MTKILATAMGAMLLLAGTPAAFASCAGDAAMSRDECMRDHGNPRECATMYRDDLRECGRYQPAPMMRRPAPKPMPTPMPPHQEPVPPSSGRR